MLIPSSFNHSEKTTTLRHKYLTRDNLQKIMVDMEKENVTYKETLAQFQGEMDTILEYLPTHKDSTTATTIVETPIKIVAQPVPNQSGSIPEPSGHATSYPWGDSL